jgi:hypothetical protein
MVLMQQELDGFPTLLLYNRGQLIEEYPDDLETEDIAIYLKDKVGFYQALGSSIRMDEPDLDTNNDEEL